MPHNELFSVVILCYRHFEYLYEAIDSVLQQNYPAIELIVSDDGSDNFPSKQVEQYIQKKKEKNIQSVQIRREEKNVGTVRHLNHVMRHVHGDFIVFLAGDDCLYNGNVLSDYVSGFDQAPQDCLIEMAQTGMYDEALRNLEYLYMTPEVETALERTVTDTTELLELLVLRSACLPSTSTCFRSGFFEKFGEFDENYVLVEDYPMHMRLAKEGWVIHCEHFIAIKHRHGGISHGRKGALARSQILYFTDIARMTREYQLSNLDVLPESDRKKFARQKQAELLWADTMLARAQKDYGKMLHLILRHPMHFIFLVIKKLDRYVACYQRKLLVFCLISWLTIPTFSQMLEKASGILAKKSMPICYCITNVLAVLWIAMFFVHTANVWYTRMSSFPRECVVVG